MIGQIISHYRILSQLGAGGMGVVYKAEDTKLDRTVALKFLAPELTRDPEAKARFIHEAKAAAALSNPNICTIYEIDEYDGQSFMAMECYEGETLKQRIERGPLPVDEAVDISRKVAQGLARAHEQGIVHRDIKPANIFITRDGLVKILDFGIAKLAGQTRLTRTGTTVGTVAYMSPEQARGEGADRRTDVWSLGAVLYEMVTGQIPFRSDREQGVIYSILNEDPPAPGSQRDDLPAKVEEVILRALAKDQQHRYASAEELAQDLGRYQQEQMAERVQPSRAQEFFRFLRRPPVIAVSLLILLGLVFVTYRLINQSRQEQWARQEALPEIERLLDAENIVEAYEFAVRAEEFIPDDPVLQDLWSSLSAHLTVTTDPPGARFYWKAYADPQSEWVLLGETPLEYIRVPAVYPRLTIEKDGYRTVEGSVFIGYGSDISLTLELDEVGSLPDEMVLIEGGARKVRLVGIHNLEKQDLNDFLMDTYEVTNKAYKQFVMAGGYSDPEYWKQAFVREGRTLTWEQAMTEFTDQTGRPGPFTWDTGDYLDGEGDHPVTGVSWYEATAYAEYAGKKLPTLYHWNRAAGTMRSADIIPLSNYDGRGPSPVGSYPGISPFGTYDMAGNVREWCRNRTRGTERFILGGGWNDPLYSFNDAFAQPPWDRSATNGFRCIRDLEVNENADVLEKDIEVPFRDFRKIDPISEETFGIHCNMYAYDPTDLNVKIESTDDKDPNYTREKVTFDAAYGNERIIVYLFLPKTSTPPYQTVLHFPGSASMHLNSSDGMRLRRSVYFVKSGRAFIYPIYKSTYERGDDMVSDLPDETNFYKEHVIMWVKDLCRVIDYLETRTDIDIERLAYYGESWGGSLGPIMMSVEDRFKAGVLYVAGLYFDQSLPEVDTVYYCPFVNVPVLMLNGRYDYACPLETSLKPMYELLGTPPEHKRLVIYETGHMVPRHQRIEESLNWLDLYLGPVE